MGHFRLAGRIDHSNDCSIQGSRCLHLDRFARWRHDATRRPRLRPARPERTIRSHSASASPVGVARTRRGPFSDVPDEVSPDGRPVGKSSQSKRKERGVRDASTCFRLCFALCSGERRLASFASGVSRAAERNRPTPVWAPGHSPRAKSDRPSPSASLVEPVRYVPAATPTRSARYSTGSRTSRISGRIQA